MASMKLAPWAFLLLFAAAQVTVEGLTAAEEKARGAVAYNQQHEAKKSTTPLTPGKVETLPVTVRPGRAITKPRGPAVALAPIAGGHLVASGTTDNGLTFNRPSGGGTNGVPPPTTLDPFATGVFYESIRFRVTTTGIYTIQSISGVPASWDNFCLLYNTNFNNLLPLTGLLASNDDNPAVGECFVQLNLVVGDYIFVTTAFRNGDNGTYSVYAAGPAPIRLQTTFYTASTVGGGTMPRVLFTPPTADATSPVAFDSLRFTVSVAGTYSLLSTAIVPNYLYDRICLLYNTALTTTAPLTGLIGNNDDYQGIRHCYIPSVSLTTGVQYYFVTSSFVVGTTGASRNSISGPGVATPVVGSVSLSQTTSARVTWNRPDALGASSTFATNTPFLTTQLCVSSAGTYSFTTTASSPTWDTFLLLYTGNFNPSKPTLSFKIGNDDSPPGNTLVSAFNTGLDKGVVYILVLTGFSDTSKGPATTVIRGPGTVSTGAAACP